MTTKAVMAARKTVQITHRAGGAVALLVGVLSVLAGSQVLLGLSIPRYTVLRPLVVYNVLAGVVSIVAGLGLWIGARWGPRLAAAIAAAHLIVLTVLAAASARGELVAAESFGAMVFRSVVMARDRVDGCSALPGELKISPVVFTGFP